MYCSERTHTQVSTTMLTAVGVHCCTPAACVWRCDCPALTAKRDCDGGFLGGPFARWTWSNKRCSGRPSKSTLRRADMCDGEKWHSNTFKTVVRGGCKGAQPPRYGASAVARCLAGEFPGQSVLYTQSLGAVGVACFSCTRSYSRTNPWHQWWSKKALGDRAFLRWLHTTTAECEVLKAEDSTYLWLEVVSIPPAQHTP